MSKRGYTRRDFIKGASALMLPTLAGGPLWAQTVVQRPDWNTFRTTKNYASLVNAIATMKENTNAADKRSWTYWVNIHVNFCPHGIPYFLAWHRGYLYYLEQQLRAVSGNRQLVLPYWNYYASAELPVEFTNPSPANPLYAPRVNTNVLDALTLAPFGATVTDMQRGLPNSFETAFETMPHNPVHNIIGSTMATMQSPADPIFFLHHANVDRLWSAWQQAGGGRTTPPASNSYWNGNLTYATRLTMPRSRTIDTRSSLAYSYQNETMPTSLPVATSGGGADGFQLAAFNGSDQLAQLAPRTGNATPRLLSRPAVGSFALTGARQTAANRLSVAGVLSIPLDETSISTQFSVDDASADLLQGVLTRTARPATRYRSARIVLDSVSISDPGRIGGYFYHIYLNLPSSTDVASAGNAYLLGSIGPFEVAGAEHRVHMNLEAGGSQAGTVQLAFPLTAQLSNLLAQDPRRVTVSFIRVSGENSPGGAVMRIGEARLELSTDAP